MAASSGGLAPQPLCFRIRRAGTFPSLQGSRALELGRRRVEEGIRYCCSDSELRKLARGKSAADTLEEWRRIDVKNSPRKIRARAMPVIPLSFARSKGLSKQNDFYPRCNNTRNNAPQSRDTPPERDTGIGSEKDWGINLLDEHVNESGVNQDGSTWYRESGEERGNNGYKCRWNKMGGQSHDGSSEWKENWWEKSDWTGYKELGWIHSKNAVKECHVLQLLQYCCWSTTAPALVKNKLVRGAMKRFQHSSETINRYFSKVVQALVRLASQIIRSDDPLFATASEQIANDSRYMPYFKGNRRYARRCPTTQPQKGHVHCSEWFNYAKYHDSMRLQHVIHICNDGMRSAEKSGKNADGDSWWETWQEILYQDEWSNLARIERSAQKQAKSGSENAEWYENWSEKYDAKGWAKKGAYKHGSHNDQSWWEKWGEEYDGRGSVNKWTDKWAAQTNLGTKWGDKWEENFFSGIGSRHGETWHLSSTSERWSRTWGEEHFGNGKVHKYGKSTTGESWDIVVDEETYYESEPHYGWADVVGDSTQLLSIKPLERPPGVFPDLNFGSSPRPPGPPPSNFVYAAQTFIPWSQLVFPFPSTPFFFHSFKAEAWKRMEITSEAKMKHSILFFLLPFLLLLLISESESVTFNCTGTTTCQSLVEYIPINSTTYSAILSLFQVPNLSRLLGANNLPLSTPASQPIPASSVVRVPLPCSCSDGKGRSNHTPVYTVKPTDVGLDNIARLTYDLLISYEEIAAANNIAAPYNIHTGEKLWIPLPCSCDVVDEKEVVHLAHLVQPGSTIDLIADEFGTSPETLLRINGIGDPRKLEAGQAIDVPLRACSSSISTSSSDSNLRLANDSYALTAYDCIQCSCSAASGYQLSCHSTQGLSKSCPSVKCDNQLLLGNTIKSGCEQTSCAYAGFTKANGAAKPDILTKTINQSLCNNEGVPAPSPGPSAGGFAGSTPSGGSPQGSSQAGIRTRLEENLLWLSIALIVAVIGSGHRA
ncbi:uncharacterized protein LOC110019171 [Phalaenopsis equestris]|uniref:uncharacterized protein LOC110019171 n=1 Tax=Phalaenopsis equestris TaxID=78828 RepID=UPI0009E495BD|nr:uncharacterized protein LOC110019171 [Phalaenopsis equestris]